MSEWEFDISPMQLNYNILFLRVITKLLPNIYRYFLKRYMCSLKIINKGDVIGKYNLFWQKEKVQHGKYEQAAGKYTLSVR